MLQKEKKQKEKKFSPKEILDDAFNFATKYPNDPMVLSASLMVVAKTKASSNISFGLSFFSFCFFSFCNMSAFTC